MKTSPPEEGLKMADGCLERTSTILARMARFLGDKTEETPLKRVLSATSHPSSQCPKAVSRKLEA